MRKWLLSVLSISALLVLLSSCQTRKALQVSSNPIVTLEQNGFALTLRFRDEPSLYKQFGSETNPFLTPYSQVFFRRLIVFELTLENQSGSPCTFNLSQCRLRYETTDKEALSQFQLVAFWRPMEDKPQLLARKTEIINKYVLPNSRPIASGGSLHGFLVFQANMPDHVEAQVLIPTFAGTEPFIASFSF
jgi:hypothetical protein